MTVEDGIIDHGTNVNIPNMPDNFAEKDQGRHTFQALVGAEVTGYDTDRAAFLGSYRGYHNPEVVEQGNAPTRSLSVTTPAAHCRRASRSRPVNRRSFSC